MICPACLRDIGMNEDGRFNDHGTLNVSCVGALTTPPATELIKVVQQSSKKHQVLQLFVQSELGRAQSNAIGEITAIREKLDGIERQILRGAMVTYSLPNGTQLANAVGRYKLAREVIEAIKPDAVEEDLRWQVAQRLANAEGPFTDRCVQFNKEHADILGFVAPELRVGRCALLIEEHRACSACLTGGLSRQTSETNKETVKP